MAGKAKFDKNAAFRTIIGLEDEVGEGEGVQVRESPAKTTGREGQVQRAYWLDKDLEKALKLKALEEEKTLTEAVNEALRAGLEKYLEI